MSKAGNTDALPPYAAHSRFPLGKLVLPAAALLATLLALLLHSSPLRISLSISHPPPTSHSHAALLARCSSLHRLPAPPPNFHEREISDRFEPLTPPTLLLNGTIWLGDDHVITGDILLDGGVIKAVGVVPRRLVEQLGPEMVTVDVRGAWVTPGIVDLHSHLGVGSSPSLRGASDTNSLLSPVQPYLRSLDGLNTHDAAYALSVAGGVTSALILPGSADNIGGQAFMIKPRATSERSSSALVVEPPQGIWNGSRVDPAAPMRWRHMKHACGENPSSAYASTRMDSIFRFRAAYAAAAALRDQQDAYCAKAEAGLWNDLTSAAFPEDLLLEALVDTLRGRVKVNVHCYEAVDFDGIVRLTNEFRFPVAAFHHASEAYLVPDLLKKAWGGAPAIAMFASNGRKKREAYRASEFAPKLLSEQGIPVVMKSDHPVMNSRFLIYEAQQAYYYGLNASLALASVTSTPAAASGFAHRLGAVKVGHDADVVVWDSHPLQLGATPLQVFIDGIAQLDSPTSSLKPEELQREPARPDFEAESREALEHEGDVRLRPKKVVRDVVFVNVGSVRGVARSAGNSTTTTTTVVVRSGEIACVGPACASDEAAHVVDLDGGALEPGLTTFGSALGLSEIPFEASTNDGVAYDLFGAGAGAPKALDGEVLRAADGLQFGGKDELLSYRAGVTLGVVPPSADGFLAGISAAFSTGAAMKSELGSVVQAVAALHVRIGHVYRGAQPSISAQVALLRKLLTQAEEGSAWAHVVNGDIPLVVHVEKADIMATLLLLKEEVELASGKRMRLTFAGANEAYLLARNIADAGVGVILLPARPFPATWDQRRTLAGPPLTDETNLSVLLAHNITTGVGVTRPFEARSTRFDAIWAFREARGRIGKDELLRMFTEDLEALLGVQVESGRREWVAYSGGELFSPEAKVVGVVSAERGVVHLF